MSGRSKGDNDFGYSSESSSSASEEEVREPAPRGGQTYSNRHYDEAVDVDASPSGSRSGSFSGSSYSSEERQPHQDLAAMPRKRGEEEAKIIYDDISSGSSPPPEERNAPAEYEFRQTGLIRDKRGYDPSAYKGVDVSDEVRELFDLIGAYRPKAVALPTQFKPFIPEFIPSVGDVDYMLKVPCPTGKEERLGIFVLDEPSANQTDPAVMDLHLRAASKTSSAILPIAVKTVQRPEKNPKAVDGWIESIRELHERKPPAQVQYTRNMPSIDELMGEWPIQFEELLQKVPLPSPDIDMNLEDYAKLCCVLMDIPVYEADDQGKKNKSLTYSLHLLFSLYEEFSANPHFAARREARKKK